MSLWRARGVGHILSRVLGMGDNCVSGCPASSVIIGLADVSPPWRGQRVSESGF